jgi:hypothetical protein
MFALGRVLGMVVPIVRRLRAILRPKSRLRRNNESPARLAGLVGGAFVDAAVAFGCV